MDPVVTPENAPIEPAAPAPEPLATLTPDMVAGLAASLAAVQAELAELKANKAQEEQTKADKAKAEMSELDRVKEDLAQQKAALAQADQSAQEAAREATLAGLGVDPAYQKVFPSGDYRDPKVKAQAEKFAADHPRLIAARQSGPVVPQDLASKLLAGRRPGSLVNPAAVQASLDSLQAIKY